MKKVIILGCTGSVGKNTLDIIRSFPEHFSVAGLSAHRNEEELLSLRSEFNEPFCVLTGRRDTHGDIDAAGENGLFHMIRDVDADIVLNAIAGSAGLMPSVEALTAGKNLALANKETLVMAGPRIMETARNAGRMIIPVDSEHSAVFQLLRNRGKDTVEEIILTASGGPFRETPAEDFQHITPGQALHHPVWRMGQKITVDSATLANKGLEVLEARFYFDFNLDDINVLVHPQGRVHSLIRMTDGAMYAQISGPDMRLPILNALSYPDITASSYGRFDLAGYSLEFHHPDFDRFPMLPLAYEAGRLEGGYPAAYNSADEAAVQAFLAGRISFTDISEVVEKTLEADWENLLISCEHAREIGFRAFEYAESIISRMDG